MIGERVRAIRHTLAGGQEAIGDIAVLAGAEAAAGPKQGIEGTYLQQGRAAEGHVAPMADIPGGDAPRILDAPRRRLEADLAPGARACLMRQHPSVDGGDARVGQLGRDAAQPAPLHDAVVVGEGDDGPACGGHTHVASRRRAFRAGAFDAHARIMPRHAPYHVPCRLVGALVHDHDLEGGVVERAQRAESLVE